MNERIRLLALKAGEYVNEVYTPPVRSKTPGKIWEDGHIGWHTQFNQKFAELIVQECINQCAHAPDVSEDWYQGVKWVSNKIAQHFGVEE
jgi:hypothetical protein